MGSSEAGAEGFSGRCANVECGDFDNRRGLDKRRSPADDSRMRLLDDLFICLRFFSRLPVPVTAREQTLGPHGLTEAAAMVPLAGVVLGLAPAAALVVASAAGLPPLAAATLSIAASILVTGALHEDALADCADGFGGGWTRERKLEIMRDSRLGAFGACALVLSLMLRVSALAALAPVAAAFVLVAAAALSRSACLLPLALLPPARSDGAGAAAVMSEARAAVALGVALIILVAIGFVLGRPVAAGIAAALGLAGALGVCRLARVQIGGQTGDVAGAVQQVVEIVVLLVFASA